MWGSHRKRVVISFIVWLRAPSRLMGKAGVYNIEHKEFTLILRQITTYLFPSIHVLIYLLALVWQSEDMSTETSL